MKKFSWRGLIIIIFMCLTAFYLAPLAFPNLLQNSIWKNKTLRLGLDLRGGMEILLEVDIKDLTEAEADDVVKSNIEIIRNRIDQFGVAEPVIQKMGVDRILVQLPGVDNYEGAETLLKQTARLEFKLVAENDRAEEVIKLLDEVLSKNADRFPELNQDYQKEIKADTLSTGENGIGKGIFGRYIVPSQYDFEVRSSDLPMVSRLMEDSLFTQMFPIGYQLAFDKDETKTEQKLYILHSNVELSGSDIHKAKAEFGSNKSDPRFTNDPYVSIEMNREGARRFEDVTAKNINRRLAIVLDDKVYSAPSIGDRIAGGKAQITGRFTVNESSQLAIVLNTGNLQRPVKPISTSIVGATLGNDSIEAGKLAGIIGFLAVIIFMLFYYKVVGFVSDFVLIFNIGFILAILTALRAALTLPGIAGIILTIGMAVDANVLIFERIKEELALGKTPRSALDAGYRRATVTIWDANITTLIAAGVLYNIGSGPIRGFATTLALGIIGSMFCSIVFVRAILENFIVTGTSKKLSI
ncbi:MAG: protein translocase subunit SecD [Candidatus Cloacimonetes bacterium]|nr:protein translocase subunit SecD [Candidatus Cloacimonadota bacterium]